MEKVFVGLSGGVDSSVALSLLKERGYDVTGVFIKTWQPPEVYCTQREDRLYAMRVCAHLALPFITLDLEKEYKEGVVDYMLEEYARGRTPNPDVVCNREIKFGAFLDFARKQGARFIATGHYAQNIFNPRSGFFELHRGVDKSKDQSYFLYNLGQAELKRVLFPVGHLQKSAVRELAEALVLPNARRKDSQGICFLGQVDMKDFLRERLSIKRGEVLNIRGKVIGSHQGAVLYTLGERHGFQVDSNFGGKPLYVVAKDMSENTLTVSPNPLPENPESVELALERVSFVGVAPSKGERLEVQTRYHGEKHSCFLKEKKGGYRALVDKPVLVSPGQSAVLYRGSECVGGGVVAL